MLESDDDHLLFASGGLEGEVAAVVGEGDLDPLPHQLRLLIVLGKETRPLPFGALVEDVDVEIILRPKADEERIPHLKRVVDRVDRLLVAVFVDEDHRILQRDRLHVAGELLADDVTRANLHGGFFAAADATEDIPRAERGDKDENSETHRSCSNHRTD